MSPIQCGLRPQPNYDVYLPEVWSNSVRKRRRRSWAVCGFSALAHTRV